MIVSKSRENAILLLLAVIQFVHIVDFMILMPLGPQLMRVYHIDNTDFGYLVAAYTFSAGIAGLLAAFFLDQFDRKRTVIFLMLGFSLGTLGCALANSYEALLFARIIAGFFGGILNAQVYTIISDIVPYERRGNAAGVIMSAFSVASVFGVPMGLKLAEIRDWHLPFEFLTVMAISTLIASGFILPALKEHLKSSSEEIGNESQKGRGIFKAKLRIRIQSFLNLFSEKKHLLAFAFMLVITFSGFSVIPFIANYLVSNLAFQEKDLPLIYLFGGAFTLFSSRIIGKLSDRYGKKRVYQFDALLALFPLLGITHLISRDYVTILIISTSFFVLVSGRMVPAMAILSAIPKANVRGSFLSIISSLQQLGAGIGSSVGGVIIVHQVGEAMQNFHWVGILSASLTVLSIIMVGLLEPKSE